MAHQQHTGHQDTARHLGNAAHHFTLAHDAHTKGDVATESHHTRIAQGHLAYATHHQNVVAQNFADNNAE